MDTAQDIAAPDRARQDARLAADVAQVLALRDQIHRATSKQADPLRVLGMVTAGGNAARYLPYTIPDMLGQIERSGRYADIVIGMNNGFRCDQTIAYLDRSPAWQVVNLYLTDKPGPAIPAACFGHPTERAAPYVIPNVGRLPRHRIFVVYQPKGRHAPGKNRMLDDICRGLLLPSIFAGWRPPQYTISFDAEALFIGHTEDRSLHAEIAQVELLLNRMPDDLGRVVNTLIQVYTRNRQQRGSTGGPAHVLTADQSDGLRIIFDTLDNQPELQIAGAITRFCTYDIEREIDGLKVCMPNFAVPCSAMHTIYNYTCGIVPGCLCMPGGGTIGRTDCMFSLLASIFKTYPGIISDLTVLCEDSLLTILAESAGLPTRLCDQVWMTNRCPALDEWTSHEPPRRAWQHQFARWYAGFDAVERLYGRHNAHTTLGPSAEDFLTASVAIFWKVLRQTDDIPGSLALLNQFASCGAAYEEIRAMARDAPDALPCPDDRPI